VTGEILPEENLVRFVAAPDGNIIPDIAATLPGRGFWVGATHEAIAMAVRKNLFARAAKRAVKAGTDLAGRTEKLLAARMLADLGLARRAGALVLGFDNVLRALDGAVPPALLAEAHDGADDGKRKLFGAAHARHLRPFIVEWLTSAELGLALGRENVIHAAVQPGGLSQRLIFDATRLKGFRQTATRTVRHERNS
jgi:predicted RNA-binding protein YlxR (DUF448 family)